MNITFESISDISCTMINDKPDLNIGESIGDHSWGVKPTYGMTADSMGFAGFVMTIILGASND